MMARKGIWISCIILAIIWVGIFFTLFSGCEKSPGSRSNRNVINKPNGEGIIS